MPRNPRRPDHDADLSLYDGTTCIGHIRERERVCPASTWPEERQLGEFPTRKTACDAISAARFQRELEPRAA